MKKAKYSVKITTQFKKDYKLAIKRGLKINLLQDVITALAMGEVLSDKYKDHALTGNWIGHREDVYKRQVKAYGMNILLQLLQFSICKFFQSIIFFK